MCSTARFSVVLIFSPANIASIRSRRPRASRELEQQPQRLVVDALAGEIEQQVQLGAREALEALRIGCEQIAQMHRCRSVRCARHAALLRVPEPSAGRAIGDRSSWTLRELVR